MRKVLKSVGILVLVMGLFFGMSLMSFAADDDIAGGVIYEKYGQITWRIDKNGHLTVNGWGDLSPDNSKLEERIPWYQYREKILSAEVDVEKMKDASYLFYECSNMTNVDLEQFQTNEVTNMMWMFGYCSGLETLEVSNFNTNKVRDMSFMFCGCESLRMLDVTNFDTSRVTSMEGMFMLCEQLKQIDVSNFDTKNVVYMTGMFADNPALEEVDVSNFDTSNVHSVLAMFRNCKSLKQLDVSNFNLKSARYLGYMFYNCEALVAIDVSNFQLSNIENVLSMFEGCNNLTYLDLRTFDLTDIDYAADFLTGCTSLCKIDTPSKVSSGYYYYLPLKSVDEGWYMPDGTNVTCLGQCGEKSVTIRKLKVEGFLDVYPEEWYASYVDYVSEKKLMNGYGKMFSPNEPMTRAMVVQTLYNMEGKPKVTDYKACLELKDVYVDWFTDAVAWAYNEGITTGYDDTKTFEVNKSVTREELAAFLYRYANYKGYDTIQVGDFSELQNIDKVTPYAKGAVNWAVGAGLISGIEYKQNGAVVAKDLAPQGTATRAQMAAILQRFCIAYIVCENVDY